MLEEKKNYFFIFGIKKNINFLKLIFFVYVDIF